MGVGPLLRRRPIQAVLVLGMAALVAMTLHPVALVHAGPEEVVLVDIVELRRFYRSLLGEGSALGGAEFFAEDGSPDLEASVDYLKERGISALEVYASYVLARIDNATKSSLESVGIRAEPIPQRSLIPIGAYAFDTKVGELSVPPPFRADPPVGGASGDFIVQFLGPQKPSWQDRIVGAGGEIKASLGRFAAVFEMTATGADAVQSLPFVEWTGLFHPAYKIAPGVIEMSGTIELDVSTFDGRDPSGALSFVQARGGLILEVWENGLRIGLDAGHLAPLARLSSVSSIELPPVWSSMNDQTTAILQAGAVGSRPVFARGIQGQGQLLTVADTGIDEASLHETLADPNNPIGSQHRKIEAYEPFNNKPLGDQTGHGTHVVATLAGDAPGYDVYNLYDGNAFAGRLYVQDIGDSNGSDPGGALTNLFDTARSKGSWIHSNSYGAFITAPEPCSSGYAGQAQSIDDFLDDSVNENFVILYAAGNFGGLPGQCLSNNAHSKNAIVVGATDGTGDVWVNSSRGLTIDGRISPTVVAPGVCIISARQNTSIDPIGDGCVVINSQYVEFSGTSMATPAVAGSVALIRQYLTEGWYPNGYEVSGHAVTPSGALLKALLVNSGVQVLGPEAFQNFNYFPNGDQGWGRPLLDDVLYFGLEGETRRTGWRYMSPGIAAGETMIFKVKVTSDVGPMNVALVWTDPHGQIGCNPDCSVNDLDLKLRSPGGNWYHGNAYDCAYTLPPGPPYESCKHEFPWQLTLDRENNVETFYRVTPPTGTWEVYVSAPFITSGTEQEFALVLTGHGLTQGIDGIVKDGASGAPIGGAKVTLTGVLNSSTTTTGSDGRFSVAAAPDTYTMTTDRCDYRPDTRSGITSDPGFLREEEVFLTKRGLATWSGKVRDDGGIPVFLATVKEACAGTSVLSAANGDYSLSTVPGGIVVTVTASKAGYLPDSKSLSTPEFGSREENFTLAGTCPICPT